LYKKQIKILDEEISKIVKNPETGQEKRGAIKGVRVHKFRVEKQLFLLAYELEAGVLKLIMVGSHENYYRNLTKYQNE
jgi:hypothetical protein